MMGFPQKNGVRAFVTVFYVMDARALDIPKEDEIGIHI
jgi:hypothetical protein